MSDGDKEKTAATEQVADERTPQESEPRLWPWSQCPCGSGVSFRKCCGAGGAKRCKYRARD